MNLDNYSIIADNKTVKKASKLYLDRKVTQLEKHADDVWTATVLDETDFQVQIALKKREVTGWDCSCNENTICRHALATINALSYQPSIPNPPSQFTLSKDMPRRLTDSSPMLIDGNLGMSNMPQLTDKDGAFGSLFKHPLFVKFWKLDDIEADIIRLVLLFHNIDVYVLYTASKELKIQYDGNPINHQQIRFFLDKLKKIEFLTVKNGSTYSFKSVVAYDFTHWLVLNDEKTKTFHASLKDFLGTSSYHISDSYEAGFRNARLAFWMKNHEAFSFPYALTQNTPNETLQRQAREFFLPTKKENFDIRKYTPAILSEILFVELTDCILTLKPLGWEHEYALRNKDALIKANPNIGGALCLVSILQGNWSAVEELLPLCSAETTQKINGMITFLKGDIPGSLASFETTLKDLRKKSGNSKILLIGYAGIMYLLSELRSGLPEYMTKAQDQVKRTINSNTYLWPQIYTILQALTIKATSSKSAAKDHLITHSKPRAAPLALFWSYMVQYWVDQTRLKAFDVKELFLAVDKAGYRWLSHELLHLLVRINPSSKALLPDYAAKTKLLGPPLVDLFEQEDDWQSALNALLHITPAKRKAAQNDTRIVWMCDFEHANIQPMEQSFGKKGWSAGKNIGLKRLKSGDVKNITPHDIRAAAAIHEGYGWGTSWEIDTDKAFVALVGHPYLFLLKSPEIAVQLVEIQPSLIAKEGENGTYELVFSHEITRSGNVIIKETPTRYALLHVREEHLRIAQAMEGKSIKIPANGREQLQRVIEGLSSVVTVQSALESDNADMPNIEADARTHIHLLPVGDGFHVEFYVKPFTVVPPYFKPGVGEATVIANIEKQRTLTKRNLKLETKNKNTTLEAIPTLKALKPSHGTWELEDVEQCLTLLAEIQPLIQSNQIVLDWPKGEKFRITKVLGIGQFRMSANKQNDWFEVKGELRVDEDLVLSMKTLLELSSQQKNSQFIELTPGKFLALTDEFRRRLREINGLMSIKKDGTMQLHPLAIPAMQGFTDSVGEFLPDTAYAENTDRLRKAFKKKFKVSPELKAELRPYQLDGFEWLSRCAEWGVGALLADDMGLGKTVQALALLLNRTKNGPVLVVAPASVCRNWMTEIEKFTPSLTGILFGEGNRKATIKKAGKGDIIVTTYDLLTRESDDFVKKKFGTIILDEAQAIKNRATKRSETVMQLQGEFKIVMTGTPIENHLGELWNLFQFCNTGLLGSIDYFNETYAAPIEKNKDQSRSEQLRRLIQPFILRRRKADVLKDLPAKTEITLIAELTADERAFYEALRRRAIEAIEGQGDNMKEGEKQLRILAEIMKLRRAACHPRLVDENADFIESAKLRLFGEVVDELLDNNHKALVFSQFVGHLHIIEAYLKEKGVAYQYLDGSTPLAKRQERIEAFQGGQGDIFLISLKAGGVGLNLTAADYVIHMDPWWNPAVEDQASDRAHRIGQERPVTVYRIVTENTIEEKIIQLHAQKRDLADSLLEGADISARLNANDLLRLIKER